jgi:4-amino-4-deoxy-L-arabinose transferase-like glycosyltransferase
VAGALLAGLLFLLAMVLFRRLSVGLIFAALISMDGLIFGRSRIAGVDVYLALFIVAAFLVLAYLLQSRPEGRRAVAETLLLPPLMGLLFGLAIATKWPGLYAIGAAVLIVLLRSTPGRWLALAGMLGLTAVFGYQALDGRPPNATFALLMVGLTVLLGVGIVRAGPASTDGPRWVNPRWRAGLVRLSMAC